MVYLHIPSNFTEEEMMLQAKYEKLKRKKKALQNLKAPRQEPERTTPIKRPQIEARDAREIAKKLIKSGAIAAIQKAPKRDEKAGFKRPRGLERKLERSLPGYQPFSATLQEDDEPKHRMINKDLYEPITPLPRRDDRPEKPLHSSHVETRTGNTVFVHGYNITKELLEKTFSQYGTIINITMESEKDRGFVTFGEASSAEGAIRELDGSVVGQSKLKVSYARRQPYVPPANDSSPASKVGSTWKAAGNLLFLFQTCVSACLCVWVYTYIFVPL